MHHTPYSHLSDEELFKAGMFMQEGLTDLELELLLRLEQRIADETTCSVSEAIAASRQTPIAAKGTA